MPDTNRHNGGCVTENSNIDVGFRDPAFKTNRTAPVHRWVPWIAGFSQQFVDDALKKSIKGYGKILDPFAGIGTTLVESDVAGHEAVGFEINPYAVFASRIKLKAHRVELDQLRDTISKFQTFLSDVEVDGSKPKSTPPDGFQTRTPFYSPKVLRKVLLAQDFINTQESNLITNLLRLAFAATMVEYSNYSYEPSLGRKSTVGRPEVVDYPVMETIANKITQMAEDVHWYRETRSRRRRKDGRVLNCSFFDGYMKLAPRSIDLLVTSPPYLNNYHYNRNTRPHLYWLGYCTSPCDMKRLETLNFGTYWQNARNQSRVELVPAIQDKEIHDTINEIRGRNLDKGIYGGPGWANYASRYFNDCVRFIEGAKWCLRPGAGALIVIGNSILQGVPVPTDRFLAKIAESQGFNTVQIQIPRNTRVGSSIVESSVRAGKSSNGTRLYESVVELRRS